MRFLKLALIAALCLAAPPALATVEVRAIPSEEAAAEMPVTLRAGGAHEGVAIGASIAAAGEIVVASSDVGAFVFRRQDDEWRQEAVLAVEGVPGWSAAVATDGVRCIVGAANDPGSPEKCGSAHVFVFQDGQWVHEARLQPGVTEAGMSFGGAVDIDGETCAVAAPLSNAAAQAGGAVFLFHRSADGWEEQARLLPQRAALGAAFGKQLDLCGDRCAISRETEPRDELMPMPIEVYRRDGGAWALEQAVVPEGVLGIGVVSVPAVALCVSRLAIAGYRDPAAIGTVQTFTQKDGRWEHEATITGPHRIVGGTRFGSAVALLDDRMLIGLIGSSAALYKYSEGRWDLAARVSEPPNDRRRRFAESLAMTEDWIFIGVPESNVREALDAAMKKKIGAMTVGETTDAIERVGEGLKRAPEGSELREALVSEWQLLWERYHHLTQERPAAVARKREGLEIPPPLTEQEIDAMSLEEARAALTRIARIRNQVRERETLLKRLEREWNAVFEHIRKLRLREASPPDG